MSKVRLRRLNSDRLSIKLNPVLLTSVLLSPPRHTISGGKHDVGVDVREAGGAGPLCPGLPGDTRPHGNHNRKGVLPWHVRGRALPRHFDPSWMLGWGWLIQASVVCITEIVELVKADK